jgi:ElaB/YqjD/DUF883 family membrane-anchored ribosome-binding protein
MDETLNPTGTDLENLTAKIEEGIRSGKYSWGDIKKAVVAKSRQAASDTDVYVRENPWKVVGIAGGLGFLLGLLMAPQSGFDE